MRAIFAIAKAAFDTMSNDPKNLQRALTAISELNDLDPPITANDLFSSLNKADINDPARILFHQHLATWDYQSDLEWTSNTARNTFQRRNTIYKLLGLDEKQRAFCDSTFPYAPALDPPIAITDGSATWRPWYTDERQASRTFYWRSYFEYLRDLKRWNPKNLAALDESSKDVVQRLADPESVQAYQSKGLVVGFVQSGKTANFTGVIARAADAGYRLIIVLAGTINILRDQTQRRLDKELIGKEMSADENYELDEDYAEFTVHGGFPSERGAFDWERLTGSKEDFKRLRKGISALEFRRQNPDKPFFDPSNLHRERGRLAVVKKNTKVLDKLIADLQAVAKRVDLRSIPSLVIDDESDQASINTFGGSRYVQAQLEKERKQRTETNQKITNLLKLLPRAQYVGYTATPFANVFIDPEDAEDLFPSDFIVSLPKPEGYMGVREFYDEGEPKPGDYTSNQNAFVRFVQGADEAPGNLPVAIDAFVLAGALKLYREKHNPKQIFKHHTMLIHNSPRVNAHAHQAQQVEKLLTAANYLGGGPGLARLRDLWNSDYSKVCAVRAGGSSIPTGFDELLPFIGECCRRIDEGPKAVLIINGDNKDDSPNFEKARIWKILVGGTKLSRGYTVEGLTVSYYRRRAGAADTLMQMGRWFGFRHGYIDLVRLYIGNNEPIDKKKTRFINLYEAFRATCQDEEEFRDQLKRYSSIAPPERITPKQVPPLVSQHMLPPTSKNKMFNARVTFKNLGGDIREKTVAPADRQSKKVNEKLLRDLLTGIGLKRLPVNISNLSHGIFEAITGTVSPERVVSFLKAYQWLPGSEKVMTEVTEFLGGVGDQDPEVEKWLFMAPQQKKAGKPWECSGEKFDIRERTRVETSGRFKVYSEPDHLAAARYFAGLTDGQIVPPGKDLRQHRQAVFLFYPVLSEEETDKVPTMGFVLVFPNNHIRRQIAYTVADPSRSDAVVVPTATRK